MNQLNNVTKEQIDDLYKHIEFICYSWKIPSLKIVDIKSALSIIRIERMLCYMVGPNQSKWINSENTNFSIKSPRERLQEGKYTEVEEYLNSNFL